MICICCGFSGFIFSGYNTPNHADLAPAYAGTLFGITNMIGKVRIKLLVSESLLKEPFLVLLLHKQTVLSSKVTMMKSLLGLQCGIWHAGEFEHYFLL